MQSSFKKMGIAGLAVVAMGATQAMGATLQWNPATPAGDWNVVGNWGTGNPWTAYAGVPTSMDTVYLSGFSGQNGTYDITLDGASVAKNIGGDASNLANLQFNIHGAGNTLTLGNRSDIKTNLALYNGTFNNQTNGWNIGTGSSANVLTVGAGALLTPGGASTTDFNNGNMTIFDGAKVVVEDGGAVQFTRERTTWIFGGELHMDGGTFGGTRLLQAQNNSTIRYTLNNGSYIAPAIDVAWEVVSLGNLAIDLGGSYVHTHGEVFNLIAYHNGDYNEVGGDTDGGIYDEFNGLADGSSLFVNGNEFVIDYGDTASPTGSIVTLTAVVPEPASLALMGLGGLAMLRRRK